MLTVLYIKFTRVVDKWLCLPRDNYGQIERRLFPPVINYSICFLYRNTVPDEIFLLPSTKSQWTFFIHKRFKDEGLDVWYVCQSANANTRGTSPLNFHSTSIKLSNKGLEHFNGINKFYLVYSCFQRLYKHNKLCFYLWNRPLLCVSGSLKTIK